MYNILIVDDERIERNGIIMLLKRLSINAGIVERLLMERKHMNIYAVMKQSILIFFSQM